MKLIPNSTEDQTAAIQALIDEAEGTHADVHLPAGDFLCADLRLPSGVGLVGEGRWSFGDSSGTRLVLAHDRAECLINATRARQARLRGLILDGRRLGKADKFHIYEDYDVKEIPGSTEAPHAIHGVMIKKSEHDREDGFFIDHCRVEGFSGDAFHLDYVWYFRIRNSHAFSNAGAGIRAKGFDGFFLDNCLSLNVQGGFVGWPDANASMCFTGNRIEWCAGGGIINKKGTSYVITGNFFDRCGGYGLDMIDGESITVTGNLFRRSGKPEWSSKGHSSHVRLEGVAGLNLVGNNFHAGRDDIEGGYSPDDGMILERLKNSVVANNTLHNGALERLIHDKGGHENTVIENNMGGLLLPPD